MTVSSKSAQKLDKLRSRFIVHGSVYSGPAGYQDMEYAAKVAASQKKAAAKVKSE